MRTLICPILIFVFAGILHAQPLNVDDVQVENLFLLGGDSPVDLERLNEACAKLPSGDVIKAQIVDMLVKRKKYDPAKLLEIGEDGVTGVFSLVYPELFVPAADVPEDKLADIIAKFDSDNFLERDGAARELFQLGPSFRKPLQARLGEASLEAQTRINLIIKIWNRGLESPLSVKRIGMNFGRFCAKLEDPAAIKALRECTMNALEFAGVPKDAQRFLEPGIKAILKEGNPDSLKRLATMQAKLPEAAVVTIIKAAAQSASSEGEKLVAEALSDRRPAVREVALAGVATFAEESFTALLPKLRERAKAKTSPEGALANTLLALRADDEEAVKQIAENLKDDKSVMSTCKALKSVAAQQLPVPEKLWPVFEEMIEEKGKNRRQALLTLSQFKGEKVYELIFENILGKNDIKWELRQAIKKHADKEGLKSYFETQLDSDNEKRAKQAKRLMPK